MQGAEIALLVAGAMAAGFVQGLSGFAFGLVAMSIWVWGIEPRLAVVIPALLIPSVLGTRLYVGLSEAAFKRVVLSLLTASGVVMIASSLPALLRR